MMDIAVTLGAIAAAMMTVDPREQFEARTYTNGAGEAIPYRLLQPSGYDGTRTYPLVLFFHGAGERGSDNEKQLFHGMADFAADAMRARHPAFVVAPQCPDGQQWVDTPWTADEHTLPEVPTDAMRLSLELVDALRKEFSIDPERIYVTGLSMGGFGAWDAISRRPELFAAGVIMCGGADVAQAERVRHVPVWMFHGDADTVVKPRRSRDMVAALRAVGARPVYTEYEGVGHNSWTATFANRAVWDWMFSQRRTRTAD